MKRLLLLLFLLISLCVSSHAQRDFNGTTDRINYGDVFNFERTDSFSVFALENFDTVAFAVLAGRMLNGGSFTGWALMRYNISSSARYAVSLRNSGTNEINAYTTNSFSTGTSRTIVMTYDGSSTLAGVHIYVNGVDEPLTDNAGGPLSSSIQSSAVFQVGARGDGTTNGGFDDARIGSVAIYQGVADAAMINRFRWYGVATGGPSTMLFWQPFWTSDLVNKGTTSATGTATGTTLSPIPRFERMWGAMMGVGR